MKKITAVIIVSVLLFSCSHEPEIAELVQNMLVRTEYDTNKITETENIFTGYTTFALRKDTIGYVASFSPNDTILIDEPGYEPYAEPVTDLVEENLLARGFVPVAEGETPDFAVNIVVLRDFSFFQTVSYPGYYSGYYGYYGYYYPIVNNHYSDYATMVIEVVDVANSSNNEYDIIWKANIGDLLTTVDLTQKTLEAIDQAFVQSPYFSKN